MKALLNRSHLGTALLIGGFIALLSFFLYKEQHENVAYLFLAMAGSLAIDLLLFRKKWLVYGTLFLVPLSLNVGDADAAASLPAEPLTALLAVLFIIAILKRPVLERRILTHPITVLLAIDTVWLMVAASTSTMPVVSLKRVAIRLVFLLVFYLFFSHWFKNIKEARKLYQLYGAGLIVVIYFTMKAHAAWGFATTVAFVIPQPFYTDHTIYGACIAFVLPFFWFLFFRSKTFNLTKGQKWLAGISLLILIAGEFFAYSRAAWLSLIAILIFALLIRFKIKLRSIIALLAIVTVTSLAFSDQIYQSVEQNEAVSNAGDIESQIKSVTNLQSDASNLERINRWVSAWNMFKEKPLTGFGPGTYQFEYAKYQQAEFKTYISTNHGNRGNAHSEYLTYLSEAGLPGFISFVLIVFVTIGTGLRTIYRAANEKIRLIALATTLGVTTFFIHGLFNSFIDTDKMASLVFGGMAILVAIDCFHLKEHSEPLIEKTDSATSVQE